MFIFIENAHIFTRILRIKNIVDLTNDSDSSQEINFLMNWFTAPTFLDLSTAHFRFVIMGASPAAFSNISTKISTNNFKYIYQSLTKILFPRRNVSHPYAPVNFNDFFYVIYKFYCLNFHKTKILHMVKYRLTYSRNTHYFWHKYTNHSRHQFSLKWTKENMDLQVYIKQPVDSKKMSPFVLTSDLITFTGLSELSPSSMCEI